MENAYAVPQGGKCSPVCSDGKRVDSLFSTLICTRPVHAEQYDTAEWHKMLDKQYSYGVLYKSLILSSLIDFVLLRDR